MQAIQQGALVRSVTMTAQLHPHISSGYCRLIYDQLPTPKQMQAVR